jgi:hypothetical protein
MTTEEAIIEFADPHIYQHPKFIFFLNETRTPDSDATPRCAYSLWDIARYNSKLMSKNVELIHINDSKAIAKYNFNKPPEPYKTYIKLIESDDNEYPEMQLLYVEESTYRSERFEYERNQLVRILGKLNAKSVYFRESENTSCDFTCMTSAPKSSGETDTKNRKMDDLMQRNLFDDKGWTEAQIRGQFRDLDVYPKKMHELINKRFSGVTFDSFSSTFSDYSNVSSHLTDVLNAYLGFGCSRQISKKITYEYTIKYFSYKKQDKGHRGKSGWCFCTKDATNHISSNASDDTVDPFALLSEKKFLGTVSKEFTKVTC